MRNYKPRGSEWVQSVLRRRAGEPGWQNTVSEKGLLTMLTLRDDARTQGSQAYI